MALCSAMKKQTAQVDGLFHCFYLGIADSWRSDAEVAAMIEQVEQESLAIVFHGDIRRARHAISEREDSLRDAQVGLIHKPRLPQGVQHG